MTNKRIKKSAKKAIKAAVFLPSISIVKGKACDFAASYIPLLSGIVDKTSKASHFDFKAKYTIYAQNNLLLCIKRRDCSRSNRTTKRGSSYLRKTLFNIMTVHLQRAPADEPV